MKCPICNKWTNILETRTTKNGHTRRRECANLHRFTTKEVVIADTARAGARDYKTKKEDSNAHNTDL